MLACNRLRYAVVELSARRVALYTGVGADGGCEALLSALLYRTQFFHGSVFAMGKAAGFRAKSILMRHLELEKLSSPPSVVY